MRFTDRIVIGMLLACAGLQARAIDPAVTTNSSQTGLPATLALRRDTTVAEEGGWMAPLAVFLLAGTGGAWAGWRRWARSRVRSPDAAPGMRVVRVSSHALTPQASLHAVQWNGEDLLLACTSQQVSVVARRAVRPAPEPEREA